MKTETRDTDRVVRLHSAVLSAIKQEHCFQLDNPLHQIWYSNVQDGSARQFAKFTPKRNFITELELRWGQALARAVPFNVAKRCHPMLGSSLTVCYFK